MSGQHRCPRKQQGTIKPPKRKSQRPRQRDGGLSFTHADSTNLFSRCASNERCQVRVGIFRLPRPRQARHNKQRILAHVSKRYNVSCACQTPNKICQPRAMRARQDDTHTTVVEIAVVPYFCLFAKKSLFFSLQANHA